MTCTRPFKHKLKDDSVIELPCGRCPACKKARSNEWASRLMHELAYHEKACFVTLTYDDEHLPERNELSKRELQLLFKRIRKNYGLKLTYFACGEYGDGKGSRAPFNPHYHAIVFGIDPDHQGYKIFEEEWPLGNVKLGLVQIQSCRYVAGYVQKKIIGPGAEFYGGRQPPFALMSKGIGKQYVIDNAAQLSRQGYYTLQGSPISLPRYYKDLQIKQVQDDGSIVRVKVLDIDKEAIKQRAIARAKELLDRHRRDGLIDEDDLAYTFSKARESHRIQAETDLVTATKLFTGKL